MLLLTRFEGQRIMIGDDIVITVCRVSGGQVKLGIDAPSNITVMREEVVSCPSSNSPEASLKQPAS